MAEIVSLGERRAPAKTAGITRSSRALAAAELVRSIGLADLVRPATAGGLARSATSGSMAGPATPPGASAGLAAVDDRIASVPPQVDGALAVAIESLPAAGTFPLRGEPDRILPVSSQLQQLLPDGGLRRGSSVSVMGSTSLLIGLLAEASRSGSWCAIVGLPTLGAVAAAEAGVALDRAALVPHPGLEWAGIVAALLDGFDIVAAAPPGPIAPAVAGRLAARARQRGSVLISYGQIPGVDLTLQPMRSQWSGLDQGSGRLRSQELTVVARGRGAAARPRLATVMMPAYVAMNEGWTSRADWADRDIDSRPDLTLVHTAE